MKELAISLLGTIVGGWLIFDGVHVLVKGKYFGQQDPGSWASAVKLLGINPFSLGVPFIILGLIWFISSYGVFRHQSWGVLSAFVVAIMSAWYLPFGTVISVLVLVLQNFLEKIIKSQKLRLSLW